MFRGAVKRGQNEHLQSEIELGLPGGSEEHPAERTALLPAGPRVEKQAFVESAQSLEKVPHSLFHSYINVLFLPVATLFTSLFFLALVSDSKVLECVQDVAAHALDQPRYVKRAPLEPGGSFYTWVVVATGCSILHVFTLSFAAFLHLRNYPQETRPASLATAVHNFVQDRQLAHVHLKDLPPSRLFLLTISTTASVILLLTAASFGYWVGGGSKTAIASILVSCSTLLELCSSLSTTAVVRLSPGLQRRFKHSLLQSCLALALLVATLALLYLISGPLVWAIFNGRGISSLKNLAVKVEVECGAEGEASQAYELLWDGVIRTGPSHDAISPHSSTRTPFEGARTPAVLRLNQDAYFVNAVDLPPDADSTPQWTIYSDEFWSIFHGGVPPNLLSFKATFQLRRRDVLVSIHVPQTQNVLVAFPYSRDGHWESAEVSLTSVHSNLRVLCPQVMNGTREFSSRTFPTNLSELRRLELSIALLGTYCPSERNMY